MARWCFTMPVSSGTRGTSPASKSCARERKRYTVYRGRRRRTCENPDRAFCTSCLHGSDSSLRGESRDASTSRRQLRPSMAMTLSMVSLRGRGVLASVREIHVGGFAVLSLLRRRLLRIKLVGGRHYCDQCDASVSQPCSVPEQQPRIPTSSAARASVQ